MKKRIYLSVDEEVYKEANEWLGKTGHLPKLAEIAFWYFMQISGEERRDASADFHCAREIKFQGPRLQVIQGGYGNEIPI
jgi:hypothetical protein